MQVSKRRILFVAEDLTLAQVVRLVALARALPTDTYEVHFACRKFSDIAFSGTSFQQWPLFTIDREAGLRRLEKGDRIYDERTFVRYVEEELRLFAHTRPDVIVGDFRLSLSVSAPHAGIPLATLINAYWSPFAVRGAFPVPDHPIVNLIGAERAARYLPQALPRAFAYFAAPLDRVRQRYGLPPHAGMLEQLTYGDFTLYPDVPELCRTSGAPDHHVYLGSVDWSADVPVPAIYDELPGDVPLVYVTLGSSGALHALPAVLEALAGLPLVAALSSAARIRPADLPENVRLAEYLPGEQMARRAAFAITNGGSGTSYQALRQGAPVLGIPWNLDQYLSMTAIEEASAGLLVRAGSVRASTVRQAVLRMLGEITEFRAAASRVAQAFAGYDCHERFAAVLDRVLGPRHSPTRAQG